MLDKKKNQTDEFTTCDFFVLNFLLRWFTPSMPFPAAYFLPAQLHCSPKAKRLSCWSQSVNQLSSHHICNQ